MLNDISSTMYAFEYDAGIQMITIEGITSIIVQYDGDNAKLRVVYNNESNINITGTKEQAIHFVDYVQSMNHIGE